MTQVSDTAPDEHSTDAPATIASLGSTLRGLRQAKGWSLEEVSSRIKFTTRQIDALENERLDELPTGVSLRGMVRNYAVQLGVDATVMFTLLEPLNAMMGPVSLAHSRLHAGAKNSPSSDEERSSGSWGWLITIVIVLAVGLAYAFWQGWLPQHWLPTQWFPRKTS
jgi:cytoskeleton protein RodZ